MASQAKHGTEALAGLAGAMLGITVAFVGYVQVRPEFEWAPTLVYLGLTTIPWVGMWVIYGTRSGPGSNMFAFDRATKILARSLIWATALGVVGTTLAFAGEVLPGQVRQLKLRVSSAEEFPWPETDDLAGVQKDEIGVRAFVYFLPYDHGFVQLPETLTVDGALDRSVASSWQIASAKGYQLDRSGSIDHKLTPPAAPARERHFQWRDLQTEFAYLLELRLKQIDTRISKEELIRRLTEDDKNTLTVEIYYLGKHIQ